MSYEISANYFIEEQTRQIAKIFKCSKPRPRNRAMGFKGRDTAPRGSGKDPDLKNEARVWHF